ncbi:MAG TPA: hypothetical protein VFN57_13600 [Thermomicrobiaceae bacterium]|nr:hypothetical protein [Thermomicrobiaceae bacterium]
MDVTTAQPDAEDLHRLMLELDRLEEVREDLEEFGLRTLEEVEARIAELHRLLDDLDGAEPS